MIAGECLDPGLVGGGPLAQDLLAHHRDTEDLDTDDRDASDRNAATRDAADREAGAGPDAAQPGRLKRWRSSTVDPRDSVGRGFDGYADEDEDDEGYTPPPPPPLPRISLITVAAVIAILAGFVLFFNPGLLPISAAASLIIGFAAILAGFATLVWRLRSGDDDDDWDPDDGAIV